MGFCNSLKSMVGARGFEPRTSTVSGYPKGTLARSRFTHFLTYSDAYGKSESEVLLIFVGRKPMSTIQKLYIKENIVRVEHGKNSDDLRNQFTCYCLQLKRLRE
jgi:hypothetical protein